MNKATFLSEFLTNYEIMKKYITNLLRNGVSTKIVAKWAGHANSAVTLSTYAHFLDEDENVSADCIDKILG